MFPLTPSRETSGLSGKQNCFPRDHTLSVVPLHTCKFREIVIIIIANTGYCYYYYYYCYYHYYYYYYYYYYYSAFLLFSLFSSSRFMPEKQCWWLCCDTLIVFNFAFFFAFVKISSWNLNTRNLIPNKKFKSQKKINMQKQQHIPDVYRQMQKL